MESVPDTYVVQITQRHMYTPKSFEASLFSGQLKACASAFSAAFGAPEVVLRNANEATGYCTFPTGISEEYDSTIQKLEIYAKVISVFSKK